MHLLSELTKVGNVSREEFEGMLLVYYRRIWRYVVSTLQKNLKVCCVVYYRRIWRYVVYYMFNLSLSWFNVE
jgi:hypothetical protein